MSMLSPSTQILLTHKGFTFDAIKQYLQTLQIPSQYLDRAKSSSIVHMNSSLMMDLYLSLHLRDILCVKS